MGSFFSVYRDTDGSSIPSASISVFDAGTSNLSSIFTDSALTLAQSNPFTANSDGSFQFFAANAEYKLTMAKTGFSTVTYDNVPVGIGIESTRSLTGTSPVAIEGDHAAHDLSADRTISLVQSAVDHGSICGLTDDDHANYVHISIARTVTVQHTFNPGSANPAFILGANALNQLIAGLNAAQVTGIAGADLIQKDGSIAFTGEVAGITPTVAASLTRKDYVDAGDAGAAGVRAKVKHATNQAITTATSTVLAWDTEDYDTDAIHDTSTNNDRLTVPAGEGGTYLIMLGVEWAGNATGYRQLKIIQDASDFLKARIDVEADSSNQMGMVLPLVLSLSAGSYLRAQVKQTSGGNLNVNSDQPDTWFLMEKLLP